MMPDEDEALLEHFMQSVRTEEAVLVLDEHSRIVRQNKAAELFVTEFGFTQMLAVATAAAGSVHALQLAQPSQPARLARLTSMDVAVTIQALAGGLRLVSIARVASHSQLSDQLCLLTHAVETMDGGLVLFKLDTATGLSSGAYVSRRYAEIVGVARDEIEKFGIAAVGSSVHADDRAVSDVVLKNAIGRLTTCYWPVRFLIANKYRWRRYFANNQSLDGRTVYMTGVMSHFDAEAAKMGLTDTPEVVEERQLDGSVKLVPGVARHVPHADMSVSDYGDDTSSVTTRESFDGTSDSSSEPPMGKCTVSRVLKRRLLNALIATLDLAPTDLSKEPGLVRLTLQKENLVYIKEELLMLVEPGSQANLHKALETNNYAATARHVADVLGTDADWLAAPTVRVKCSACEWLPVLQLLLHQLEASPMEEPEQTAVAQVVRAVLVLAPSLSGVAESCALTLFSHELLRLAAAHPACFAEKRQRALLGQLVTAAVSSGSTDAIVLANVYWLSVQWGLFQWPRQDLCVEILSSCAEDLEPLVASFPHSAFLSRLFAIAQHNLHFALKP